LLGLLTLSSRLLLTTNVVLEALIDGTYQVVVRMSSASFRARSAPSYVLEETPRCYQPAFPSSCGVIPL
jgi:hypothetical protein